MRKKCDTVTSWREAQVTQIPGSFKQHLPDGIFEAVASFHLVDELTASAKAIDSGAYVVMGPVFTLEYTRLRALDTQFGWLRKSGRNGLYRPIRPVVVTDSDPYGFTRPTD